MNGHSAIPRWQYPQNFVRYSNTDDQPPDQEFDESLPPWIPGGYTVTDTEDRRPGTVIGDPGFDLTDGPEFLSRSGDFVEYGLPQGYSQQGVSDYTRSPTYVSQGTDAAAVISGSSPSRYLRHKRKGGRSDYYCCAMCMCHKRQPHHTTQCEYESQLEPTMACTACTEAGRPCFPTNARYREMNARKQAALKTGRESNMSDEDTLQQWMDGLALAAHRANEHVFFPKTYQGSLNPSKLCDDCNISHSAPASNWPRLADQGNAAQVTSANNSFLPNPQAGSYVDHGFESAYDPTNEFRAGSQLDSSGQTAMFPPDQWSVEFDPLRYQPQISTDQYTDNQGQAGNFPHLHPPSAPTATTMAGVFPYGASQEGSMPATNCTQMGFGGCEVTLADGTISCGSCRQVNIPCGCTL